MKTPVTGLRKAASRLDQLITFVALLWLVATAALVLFRHPTPSRAKEPRTFAQNLPA